MRQVPALCTPTYPLRLRASLDKSLTSPHVPCPRGTSASWVWRASLHRSRTFVGTTGQPWAGQLLSSKRAEATVPGDDAQGVLHPAGARHGVACGATPPAPRQPQPQPRPEPDPGTRHPTPDIRKPTPTSIDASQIGRAEAAALVLEDDATRSGSIAAPQLRLLLRTEPAAHVAQAATLASRRCRPRP